MTARHEPDQANRGGFEPPSYDFVLDWMRDAPHRAWVMDFWARGNYARRLMHLRAEGTRPFLVRVTQLDEMRWAYRRLALLGAPVEFIFCGDCKHDQVSLMCPSDRIEGGVGYVGIADDSWLYRGRRHFPVTGFADTMPEAILDWLVDEEADAFRDGRLFVSPATLVGIDPTAEELDTLVEMARGVPVLPGLETARAMLTLDLPYLDQMSPRSLARFLRENEAELARFRTAFQRLFDIPPDTPLQDQLEALKHEIAELTLSDKYHALRVRVAQLGGLVATVTAAVSIALKPNVDPVFVGTAAGGAVVALLEILRQKIGRAEARARNSYSLLWNLGISRPSQVKRRRRIVSSPITSLPLGSITAAREIHWLQSPTEGLKWLVEVSGR